MSRTCHFSTHHRHPRATTLAIVNFLLNERLFGIPMATRGDVDVHRVDPAGRIPLRPVAEYAEQLTAGQAEA
jgi:hypothetical protein